MRSCYWRHVYVLLPLGDQSVAVVLIVLQEVPPKNENMSNDLGSCA